MKSRDHTIFITATARK